MFVNLRLNLQLHTCCWCWGSLACRASLHARPTAPAPLAALRCCSGCGRCAGRRPPGAGAGAVLALCPQPADWLQHPGAAGRPPAGVGAMQAAAARCSCSRARGAASDAPTPPPLPPCCRAQPSWWLLWLARSASVTRCRRPPPPPLPLLRPAARPAAMALSAAATQLKPPARRRQRARRRLSRQSLKTHPWATSSPPLPKTRWSRAGPPPCPPGSGGDPPATRALPDSLLPAQPTLRPSPLPWTGIFFLCPAPGFPSNYSFRPRIN